MSAPVPPAADPGFAPAKINLSLHVTGQRADGYHLLDSLVAFADVGDRLDVRPAPALSLRVSGPMAAGVPEDGSNLVLKAALALTQGGDEGLGASITLDKHLPAAAGIGGGSADAAAALRLLSELWSVPLPDPEAVLALGADVPVCLHGRACRMRGLGEVLSAVPPLPPVPAVLVNPRVEVPTPAVFKLLAQKDNPPMPETLGGFADVRALAEWLAGQRNDLEGPARQVQPVIGAVLAALEASPGALLARMSGSGATCFALHESAESAADAAARLAAAQPGWWVRACHLR